MYRKKLNNKLKKKIITLALVAARAGSKGFKNKNLIKLNNNSIVKLAVNIGLDLKEINHVALSSDSQKILSLSKEHEKLIKIKRPISLAKDKTPMLPVMQNTIKYVENILKKKISFLIILDPTSPLRIKKDIKDSIKFFKRKKLDLLVSANNAEHNPYFSILEKRKNSNYYSLSKGNNLNIGSRQKAKKVFNINTIVWIYSRRAIMNLKKRIPLKTDIFLTPSFRSLEINTKEDWIKIKDYINKRKN